MSTMSRCVSAIFTALASSVFFILYLASGLFGRDYFWGTYLAVLSVLFLGSLSFGFALPAVLRGLGLRKPWMWIMLQGALSWLLALVVLGVLNLTPLCVGQNNGDGNNNLSMCIFYSVLSGIVYTPVYLVMQAVSSMIGQWVLTLQMKSELMRGDHSS